MAHKPRGRDDQEDMSLSAPRGEGGDSRVEDEIEAEMSASSTLHELLLVQEDKVDLSLVEKVTVPQTSLLALCNSVVPNSGQVDDDRIVVNFNALNKIRKRVVGLYGCKAVLADVIRRLSVVDAITQSQLTADKLAPGVYGAVGADDVLYAFYWHPGSRMGAASRKDMSCNFIRYLVDLCDTVYVCLDDKEVHLALTDFSASTTAPRTRRGPDRRRVCAVKESEDNIKVGPGFHIFPPIMKTKDEWKQLASASSVEFDLRPRLSTGVSRCAVITPTVRPPRNSYQYGDITVKEGELRQKFEHWSNSYSIDINGLADQDLGLLLQAVDLPGSQEYRDFVAKPERPKQEDANNIYCWQKPDQQRIVTLFNRAVSIYLKRTYPWEAKYLSGDESVQMRPEATDDENMIQVERELCEIWMGWPPGRKGQQHHMCLLFVGSEICVVNEKARQDVWVVTWAQGTSPILSGQEFWAVPKQDQSRSQIFTLQPMNTQSQTSGITGPVILSHLFLDFYMTMRSANDKMIKVEAKVKISNPARQGMIDWIHSSVQPNLILRDLRRRADILSYVISDGTKEDSERVLENLSSVSPAELEAGFSPDAVHQFLDKYKLATMNTQGGIHRDVLRAGKVVFQEGVKTLKLRVQTDVVENSVMPMLEATMRTRQDGKSAAESFKEEEVRLLQRIKQAQPVQPERETLQVTQCCKQFRRTKWPLFRASMMRVQYMLLVLEPELVTWQMTELTPARADLDKSARDKNHVIEPHCLADQTCKLIDLDPNAEVLKQVVTLKSGETLIFVENTEAVTLSVYVRSKRGCGALTDGPLKVFRRGFDLVAFDEHTKLLALYSCAYEKIDIYKLDESFRHLERISDVQLAECVGLGDLTSMIFIPGKRELLLMDTHNGVRVLEVSNMSMLKPVSITLPAATTHACVTTDGFCLLVFYSGLSSLERPPGTYDQPQGSGAKQAMYGLLHSEADQACYSKQAVEVNVYILNDRLPLLKRIRLENLATDMTQIVATVTSFGSQMHLLFLDGGTPGRGIFSVVLQTTSASQSFKLQPISGAHAANQDHQENAHTCPELDYIPLIFEKFSTNPPLLQMERALFVHLLLGGLGSQAQQDSLPDTSVAYVSSAWKKMKSETRKDFSNVTIHFECGTIEKYFGSGKILLRAGNAKVHALGDWIRDLFCLVPIQIARAENNSLRPLRDGLQFPPDITYGDAVSLSQCIRFGFYDAVLSHWSNSVKIVSSMGKQSSGKSYLLNHLSGSLLDVAGGRCTDGVWMTLRCAGACLYVILDFEGLGSFERSEQEDMLLSILNAAVSNITIFNKKDFHLDKEMERVFARFQIGTSLVKEDSRLFKGIFYMAIKDVPEPDVEDLKEEFWGKLDQICETSSDGNFLTKMYGSDVMIDLLPPFQREDFHRSICQIADQVTSTKVIRPEFMYTNGTKFASDFKLIIAQISAKDWSTMDTKRIGLRIDNLQKHLESTAISLGRLNRQVDSAFTNFETHEEVADTPVQLDEHEFTFCDTGLELSQHGVGQALGVILQSLQQKYEEVVKRTGCDDEMWHGGFQRFLQAVAERRRYRVLQWLDCNTEEFKSDGDIQSLRIGVDKQLGDMMQRLSPCKSKCHNCFLLCVLEQSHPSSSQHNCMGSHRCWQTCQYCTEGGDKEPPYECSDVSGHQGAHDCKQRYHTCKEACIKAAMSATCNKVCHLRRDHEGDHLCNTRQHLCGVKCSLPSCRSMCAIDAEIGHHDRHMCHEKMCPESCMMEGCNRRCDSKDHFHDLTAQNCKHLCGNQHPCMEDCQTRGMCQIVTDIVSRERTFTGKRSQFKYEHLSEQNGIRKKCCIPIPVGQDHHEGVHTHAIRDAVQHFCDQRCKACSYFCHLPIDHPGLHDTTHGNMRDHYFASESEEIDLEDRKYQWGESAIAELCMMHCRAQGRGHVHLIECEASKAAELASHGALSTKKTQVKGSIQVQQETEAWKQLGKLLFISESRCMIELLGGARHQTRRYGPDCDVAKDELTHSAYWRYLRFKDPCPDEAFELCNHYCHSEEHVSSDTLGQKNWSYCTEKLWHPAVTKEVTGTRAGHVTPDGHLLMCEHRADLSHIIFIIDRSVSMNETDFLPTMSKFASKHSNRLGCVYEAMARFTQRRPAFGVKDSISVILFNHIAVKAVDRQTLDESLIDGLLSYEPCGGTSYSQALELAQGILRTASNDSLLAGKPPVVILLGDGEDYEFISLKTNRCLPLVTEMKALHPELVLHTIFIGKDNGGQELMKELAKLGGGQFTANIDQVELARTFQNLALTLRPPVNSAMRKSAM